MLERGGAERLWDRARLNSPNRYPALTACTLGVKRGTMTTAQVQVGWRFVSEGLPAHGEFFGTLPSGIGEGDPRYEPVFLLEEDAANEPPLRPLRTSRTIGRVGAGWLAEGRHRRVNPARRRIGRRKPKPQACPPPSLSS